MPDTKAGSKTKNKQAGSKKIKASKIVSSEQSEKKKTKKIKSTTVSSEQSEKKKTKKKISKSVDVNDFELKMDIIRDGLRKNYLEQKKLIADLKELQTLHKKEIKSVSNGIRKESGKLSGFNQPKAVPEDLRKLLGIKETELLSRSKVTHLLYKYFTENGMYDKKTKKEIIPNSSVRKIFGMKKTDSLNFYNMQTWLRKLYDESTEEKSESESE
jgi:chromatin remodeling complex protein RSC6